MENIKNNMLIVGKRYVGKTSFIISLLQNKKYSQGNIFCLKTDSECYKEKFPELNIHNELTENMLNNIIEQNNSGIESIIVIDDLANAELSLVLKFLDIFKKNNITLIMTSQIMYGPSNTFDCLGLFKEVKETYIRYIYDRVDCDNTFSQFVKTMNELDDYSVLIYNKNSDVKWSILKQ